MRVIAKKTLITFYLAHKDAEQALKAWYDEAAKANWTSPNEIKAQYRNASFIGSNRVIFNISGNKYRLIVAVAYQHKAVFIKFIGTHEAYDTVDALKVGDANR
jgi:mRNA interferase HigB